MRTGVAPRWVVAVVLVLMALVAIPSFRVQALPRYGARYEQTCALCHVNPTGGGMRTRYAAEDLAPRELALSPAKPEALEALDTRLSKHVTVGADFREVYVASDDRDHRQDFFLMQGDVYLSFQLDSTSTLSFDRGLSNTYELFGLHYPRPWLYVKAGRFVPAYGWKFDDHTHSVREDLGFGPPLNSDVGLELGVLRGPLDVQLGVSNGAPGALRDNDGSVSGNGSVLYRFRGGPLAAAAGASGIYRRGNFSKLDLLGLRASLSLPHLTWLGEVDRMRRESQGPQPPVSVELSTSHELSWALRQGLELLVTYDFYDPDTDLQSGSRNRYGGGLFLMPRPYFSIEALYRTTRVDRGPALTTGDWNEAVAQLHVFF